MNNKKALYNVGVYLLAQSVVGVLIALLTGLIIRTFFSGVFSDASLTSLLNFLIYVSMVIPMYIIMKDNLKEDYEKFKEKIGINILLIVFTFFLLFTITIIVSAIKIKLGFDLTTENQSGINDAITSGLGIFMVLAAIFLGPTVEEIIFRFSFFVFIDRFTQGRDKPHTLDPILHILLSSLAFGLIHIIGKGDYYNILVYGLMGIPFGIIYFLSNRNLIVVISAHILWNAFATLPIFLT